MNHKFEIAFILSVFFDAAIYWGTACILFSIVGEYSFLIAAIPTLIILYFLSKMCYKILSKEWK